MSGGHTQATTSQRYNGMQIGSSAYGGAVPILYGRQRVSFTLIWYDNFKSTPTKQSGGKGGSGQQTSSYNYSSSWAAALLEGPISQVITVWQDKDLTTLAAQGLTLFNGAGGQATWSYLTTNFPAAAIPYDHTAYVGAINFNLGGSAALPNLTFEVDGLLGTTGTAATLVAGTSATNLNGVLSTPWAGASGQYTVTFSDFESFFATFNSGSTAVAYSSPLQQNVSGSIIVGPTFDSDPALFMPDYVMDLNHGMGRPSSFMTATTGTNSYQSYVRSMGMLLSPYENTQRTASDFVSEILQITNSDAVWTGAGQLKIVPYADQPVAGNNFSYTPNITPVFSFGPDDYIITGGAAPVRLTRKSVANTYNHIKVEYLDRSNSYNTAIAEATDMDDINKNGERVMSTLSYHEITNASTARLVAQFLLQTNLYERNTVAFTVRADYGTLEPMDYIAVTDAGLVYNQQLFRCTKVITNPNHEVEIEAMEIAGSVRTAPLYQWQSVQGYNANFAVAPGSVPTPVFMEASGTFVDPAGGRELYIGVCGPNGGTNWGGCQVWMSFDNVTYDQIGMITSQSAIGTLNAILPVGTSDPDTGNTLQLNLTNDSLTMTSGTAADADNNRILLAIDPNNGVGALEILSYASVTLVSTGNYSVTYMRRGQYNTTNQAHAAGAQFMLLNGDTFVLPIDPGWIGQTLFFKFPSYNLVGRGTESLAAVSAYTFTPIAGAVAYNSSSQSTFSTLGNGVVYSPTTAFKRPNGSVGWDSSVYAVQGYTDGCSAECYPSQTNAACMMGLTTNPTASASYTNLNHAWYFVADGGTAARLQIYESGTFVGTFGTYNTSDLLAITHDGKHVCYWHNGLLIRSVPIGHTTFFMQLAFATDNAAVYGMSFSSNPSNTAPFTIIPLTLNVAVSGTRVVAPTTSPSVADGWSLRTFQSRESFNNGCQVSFSTDSAAYQFVGLTASASPGTTSFPALLAGWYIANASSVVHIFFNGTDIGGFGNTSLATATDVFTITYDGYTIRWWRNGALQHQEYSISTGVPLYLYGDIYRVGNDFFNISFGPFGTATPNPFVATGQCVVHDSTAQKVSGAAAWDSSVYSLNGYSNCHVQFKPSTPFGSGTLSSSFMVGLAQSPTLSASYTNLDFAFYCTGTALQIYQSGVFVGSFGTISSTDLLAITYDGNGVAYFINGIFLFSVHAPGLTLFMSSSFLGPTPVGINSLSFGPGITLDLIPTGGMDLNAASQMVSSYLAGPFAPPPATPGVPSVATIGSLNIITTGSPVGVDITLGIIQLFNATGTTAWNMQLTVLRDSASTGVCPVATWDSSTMPWAANGYVAAQPTSFVFVDSSVPAGHHTYSIQLVLSNSGSGGSRTQMNWGQQTIKLREIKR